MIHGNCVSIGCVSLMNEDYIKLFSYYLLHNSKKYGKAAIYIFPFKFDENVPLEVFAKDVEHRGELKDEQIVDLWKNLKEGYDIFLKTADPLNFTIRNGRYHFSKK